MSGITSHLHSLRCLHHRLLCSNIDHVKFVMNYSHTHNNRLSFTSGSDSVCACWNWKMLQKRKQPATLLFILAHLLYAERRSRFRNFWFRKIRNSRKSDRRLSFYWWSNCAMAKLQEKKLWKWFSLRLHQQHIDRANWVELHPQISFIKIIFIRIETAKSIWTSTRNPCPTPSPRLSVKRIETKTKHTHTRSQEEAVKQTHWRTVRVECTRV